MKKWKDIHPISWTIIIGTIFGRMATSMSIPFLAIYLTAVQGASASYAGWSSPRAHQSASSQAFTADISQINSAEKT